LTIEIGVDALKFATENGQYRSDGGADTDRPEVTNALGFARVVARELMDEVGEDGSTPITLALDRAIESALESDTVNVRMAGDA
jgi:hypothetical protein